MTRLIHSFRFALKGIRIYLLSGGNVPLHILATVMVIFAGWWLDVSFIQWCLLILAMTMVHVAEAFNTAIEKLVDFISPDHHQLAEKIKDLSAGAVLLTAIGAAIIGCIVFGKALFAYF